MEDIRVGLTVRGLRRRQGMRQSDLARLAGIAQATVSRLERGHLDHLAMATVRSVFAALEATVEFAPRWRGGEIDRLLDAGHATLATAAASFLTEMGWVVVPEFSFSVFGERGSIDLLALRETDALAVMIEVKTSINSVEELLRKTDMKARLLPGLVAERYGWRPRNVARILVLAQSRTNRRRMSDMGPLLAAAFPGSTVETKQWLRSPGRGRPGVWLIPLDRAGEAGRSNGGRDRVRVPKPPVDTDEPSQANVATPRPPRSTKT